VTATTVREALLAAAEEIEQRGWYQGNWYSGSSEYAHLQPPWCPKCVQGALCQAVTGWPVPIVDAAGFDLYIASLLVLEQVLGVSELGSWNDSEARTQDQVVAALRTAAEQAGPAS
jgi:hypothetical protein